MRELTRSGPRRITPPRSAAVEVILAIARDQPGLVLESVWHRSRALAEFRALPGPIVEVFCRCDRPTLEARYEARATTRAAGHFHRESR